MSGVGMSGDGKCPGWEMSGMGCVQDENCSGGKCPEWKLSRWEMSGMGYVRDEKCLMMESVRDGKYPRYGMCPDTLFYKQPKN